MWKHFHPTTAWGVLLHNMHYYLSLNTSSEFSRSTGGSIHRRTPGWWDGSSLGVTLHFGSFFLVMSSTTIREAHPAPWTQTWRRSYHQPECIITAKLHDIFLYDHFPRGRLCLFWRLLMLTIFIHKTEETGSACNRGGSALSSLAFSVSLYSFRIWRENRGERIHLADTFSF